MRKGEQPSWVVLDGRWARIQALSPVIPRVMAHNGVSPEVLAAFSAEDLAEIAEHKPTAGEDKPDAIDYAHAWELHVEKIDNDRALPSTDHAVSTEHDFAGALFQRDFLEQALARLRPVLVDKLWPYMEKTDERFRSFTSDDSGDRMARIAGVGVSGRGWWWYRVPSSGPISADSPATDSEVNRLGLPRAGL